MQVERSGQQDLSPEDQAHLEKLRHLVEAVLADGKVSETEIQAVRELVHSNHKVTPEELQTIRSTVREMLGDAVLEYDWG